jgi:S-methylmethionine-dependent homocysteine/selenocysteine methylase
LKTVILDGGMGQELVKRSSRPITPQWSTDVLLHEPHLVTQLHADYIDAGADVITVASYSASPERLARDGLAEQFEELQQAACRCAAEARDRSERVGVRIAGCLPPLVASYRADTVPDEAQSIASYRRIVQAQAGKVDLLLCETMSSIDEARFAVTAAQESGLPVWVAMTVGDELIPDAPALLRSGERMSDAAALLVELGVQAVLVNCSSPEASTAALDDAVATGLPAGVYANAFQSVEPLEPGGTVASLTRREDLDPDTYAAFAATWRRKGASIIGGCCETAPAHIAALRQRLLALGLD